MNSKLLSVLITGVLVASCSKESAKSTDAASDSESSSTISLPSGGDEVVNISGEISFWMHEGAAGCYGTLEVDSSEVQLWSPADLCENIHYSEKENVSVKIKYSDDNQYGPGTTYTVVEF